MTVFVDTSALFALLDEDDDAHARAARTLASIRGQPLVTHSYVVVESVALVGRKLGWAGVERLFEALLPLVETQPVDDALHRQALSAFRESGSDRVSLVDRTSFAFMQRTGLTRAFAFDNDFVRAGFVLA